MEAKKGWFKRTLGKRLNSLHTWNAWVVVVLAVSGVVLSIGAIRGELGAFRVTLKQLHIGFGLISIVLLALYAPLLRKHWKQLRGRSGQRGNLLLVLGLLLGWSVSGLVLWQYRSLPPVWNNTALLIHDLLTWVGIPYALYHSLSRSRWLKRRQREEQAAAAAAARAVANAEREAVARTEQRNGSAAAGTVDGVAGRAKQEPMEPVAHKAQGTEPAEGLGLELGKAYVEMAGRAEWEPGVGEVYAEESGRTDQTGQGDAEAYAREGANASGLAEEADAGLREPGEIYAEENGRTGQGDAEAYAREGANASGAAEEAGAGVREAGEVYAEAYVRGKVNGSGVMKAGSGTGVPGGAASETDAGAARRSAANAVIAALKASPITRASFLRLTAGLLLLLGVGPAFYRWLKGIGAFSTEGLDDPLESAVSDGNHMLPAPEPLPESAAVVGGGAKGRFRIYTVTEIPAFSSDSWKFAIAGLVDRPMVWSWEQFLQMKRTVQVSDFHCITGWSVYQLTWEGIPLKQLLAEAGVQARAKYVKFYSGDNVYTDALSLEQAVLDDVMVAVLMDGKPIPQKLGGPVRLVVPKMYAYKSVKWLQGIELIEEEHIGYWEVRGYDNDAWVKRG